MQDEIMEALTAFLDAEDWACQVDESGSIARMRFRGTAGEWNVTARVVGAGRDQLVVHSLPGPVVPEGRRIAAAEIVARLNEGLVRGNWELDMDSGIVRFKTSADCQDRAPSRARLGSLLFTNMVMTNRYLPALHAVVFGGRDAAEAVAEVESEVERSRAAAAEDQRS